MILLSELVNNQLNFRLFSSEEKFLQCICTTENRLIVRFHFESGSSRPESTRPGQLGRVKSALYIRYSCVLVDRERCSKKEYKFVIHYVDFLKLDVSSLLLLYLTNHQHNMPM